MVSCTVLRIDLDFRSRKAWKLGLSLGDGLETFAFVCFSTFAFTRRSRDPASKVLAKDPRSACSEDHIIR